MSKERKTRKHISLWCMLGFHDWDYNEKPKGKFPIELINAPYTFSAVCRRCKAELFEGQFEESYIKSIIKHKRG